MQKAITCAAFLASCAVTLGLLAPPNAAAETALTVAKASANADNMLPINVGAELGIFKKHGLDGRHPRLPRRLARDHRLHARA